MDLPHDIALRVEGLDVLVEERVLAWLSEEEHRRWRSYGSRRRARQFLLGRALAREMLAERWGVEPGAVRLTTTDRGAPRVLDEPGAGLSIAHSGRRAAVAVADRTVGVDLERIEARRPDLYRRFLQEDEFGLIDRFSSAGPDVDPAAQILCWTLKEAVLKAHGTGLDVSPRTLRIEEQETSSSEPGGFGCVRVAHRESEAVWRVLFQRRDEYYLSVAFPLASNGASA